MEKSDAQRRVRLFLGAVWERALPFRFLVVGAWNFGFSYVFFAISYWLLHPVLPDVVILAICSIVGITNAFVCHRWLTYRSEGPILQEYFRFYLVYGTQIGLNFVLFLLFVRWLKANPYLTQALLTIVLTGMSYWGHKRVSFRERGGKACSD